MVAEHFAVVRGEDDEGVVALSGFFEAVEQVADLRSMTSTMAQYAAVTQR